MAVLLFAGIQLAGCSGEAEPAAGGGGKPSPEAVPVQLETVRTADLDRTAEVVGTLYGDEEVVISAKVSGRVASIDADVGDRVPGGAVLAQIDPTDYQLEVSRQENALSEALAKLGLAELPPANFNISTISTVQRARAQAANAKAKFERAQKLFEQTPPLMSEQDYADMQTAYEVAVRDHEVAKLEAQSLLAAALSRKSELDAAKQRLADTRAVPPAVKEGRKFAVASRAVSTGEFVQTGTSLFRVVLDDVIKFRGALPERFASQVRPGQTVTLRIAGLDGPAVGTIARVSPSIDLATRTFQIEATFDNADQRLRPGAFARGTITVGQDKGVPIVPRHAVVSFAGLDKIYTAQDGEAVENVVTLGPVIEGGKWIAVPQGLKDTKEVIVEGLAKLARGVPIEVQPLTQPTTAPASRPAIEPDVQPGEANNE